MSFKLRFITNFLELPENTQIHSSIEDNFTCDRYRVYRHRNGLISVDIFPKGEGTMISVNLATRELMAALPEDHQPTIGQYYERCYVMDEKGNTIRTIYGSTKSPDTMAPADAYA